MQVLYEQQTGPESKKFVACPSQFAILRVERVCCKVLLVAVLYGKLMYCNTVAMLLNKRNWVQNCVVGVG